MPSRLVKNDIIIICREGPCKYFYCKKIKINCIDICIRTVKWSKKVFNKAPRPCILPLRCRIQEEIVIWGNGRKLSYRRSNQEGKHLIQGGSVCTFLSTKYFSYPALQLIIFILYLVFGWLFILYFMVIIIKIYPRVVVSSGRVLFWSNVLSLTEKITNVNFNSNTGTGWGWNESSQNFTFLYVQTNSVVDMWSIV